MSRHDLVSAQTSNVYITHAPLNAIAYIVKQFAISLPAISLEMVQCEQKGWDRGRWVGIYTHTCSLEQENPYV